MRPARSRTTYVFRTSAAPSAAQLPVATPDGGHPTLVLALVISGLVLRTGVLVVVWAAHL